VYQDESLLSSLREDDQKRIFVKADNHNDVCFYVSFAPYCDLSLDWGHQLLYGSLFLRGRDKNQDNRKMSCTVDTLRLLIPLVAEFNERKNVVKLAGSGIIV
jgi:hypothetical protein